MTDLPNVLRCPHCQQPILIDLFGEGFDPAEIAAKTQAHRDREHP